MIICICNNVSDKMLRELITSENVTGLSDIQDCIKVCDECCKCKDLIEGIIEENKE